MSEGKFRHRTSEGKFRLLATFIFYLHAPLSLLAFCQGQVEAQVNCLKLQKRLMGCSRQF
jgi:hypothetical protein